jgi:hypothetical protein
VDIKYIKSYVLSQLYSKYLKTFLTCFNTRNNMTPDIVAYVSEIQLLTELALGEGRSTVLHVTMLKNSEWTVIGMLLGNKYFQLYKNSIYSSFPKRNIFSGILLHLINTAHIKYRVTYYYVSVSGQISQGLVETTAS